MGHKSDDRRRAEQAAAAGLAAAMARREPSCAGDDRFTRTRLAPMDREERRELYLICFECPIFDACSEYARQTRPAAGYWAGKNYGTWERPER